MRGRLVLALPRPADDRKVKGRVYSVEILDDEGKAVRNLLDEFLQRASTWEHPRARPQLAELRRVFDRVLEKGAKDLKHVRPEGSAIALPEDRYEGWETELGDDLEDMAPDLRGLPALRVYGGTFGKNLVMCDGNVKWTEQVYQSDSGVLLEFNEAGAIIRTLNNYMTSGRLRMKGRTGEIDLNFLGSFEINL